LRLISGVSPRRRVGDQIEARMILTNRQAAPDHDEIAVAALAADYGNA
jgi:hypothetical protein